MKYKACIFDLDGTLLDTIDTIAYYCNLSLKEFGYPEIDREKYKYFVGNGALLLVQRMLAHVGESNENVIEKVYDFYNAAYNADTKYKTKVYEGVRETLEKMKANGIKIGVLSNKPHFATRDVLREFFGEGFFDISYGQREGFPIKPDPAVAISMARELDVLPSECLYAGDTAVDMKTGKGAGFYTVGVLWGFRTEEELLSGGADKIISHPAELEPLVI